MHRSAWGQLPHGKRNGAARQAHATRSQSMACRGSGRRTLHSAKTDGESLGPAARVPLWTWTIPHVTERQALDGYTAASLSGYPKGSSPDGCSLLVLSAKSSFSSALAL